jgi:RluA family pseudouridine synthase
VTLPVLAQADGWVVIAKPPGLPVIPGRAPEDHACAKDLLAAQLGTRVWVCHRIDRDTSGAVLFATTAEAHRVASMAFERGEVSKRYLALVEGELREPLDIDVPLAEARRGKMRPARADEPGAKPSRTLVRPVEVLRGATLVECEPLTGRQHQIRVHLKAKGHPLLFDHQYGRKEPLVVGGVTLARTPLHAARLEVPALGVKVECPLAADLVAVVEALRGGATSL